jgi:uncharacterized phage-like protein YoqJ
MRPVKTIAVTGHRALPVGAARHIEAALHQLAAEYPGATWLTGGALGSDQIAASVLLARGERVELVLPFPPAIQAARWSVRAKATFRNHLARVAAVHIVHPRYCSNGYRDRNRRLVDRADLMFAAWNGRPGSGTAMTVRMAGARGVPVIWVEMT